MERRVFDINTVSIIASLVRGSWCGSPYLRNLLSELPSSLLKLYKGLPYLMGLLKRNVWGIKRISLTGNGW